MSASSPDNVRQGVGPADNGRLARALATSKSPIFNVPDTFGCHPVYFLQWEQSASVEETLVVKEFDNDKRPEPKAPPGLWKTFAVYSGAALQWGTCVVVFSYLGHLLGRKWDSPWLTAVGALLGIVVGGAGLVFLARQVLGDRGE